MNEPKDLVFGNQGRQKLLNGVSAISSAVKSTLGARGNTVLIESRTHTHGITVTKDGVTVAKAINLTDPVENLAVKMMKEAAEKTATSAGDGTTTAIVLTEALVKSGMEAVEAGVNVGDMVKDMNDTVDTVIKNLEKKSKKVSGKTLKDVAIVSANNDRDTGVMIASAYKEVGKEGIITVEKSQNSDTYYEVTNGLRIDRGYTSKLFINNQKKDECVLEDAYIMVCDQEINNIISIEKILKPIINGNKSLLVIAPCSDNVVNTLSANVVHNNLKFCNIIPPEFGYKTKELMQDIAISVGAKYYSEATGDDLSLMTIEDLGHAKKIVVGREDTVIVKEDKVSKEALKRVEELWGQHDNTQNAEGKEFIKSRIASLTGGVGVIYVGGNTDIEQKEKYDRVDDAVCAVRSALEEGILPGGGVALFYESISLGEPDVVGVKVVKAALESPLLQICGNANMDTDLISADVTACNKPNYGFDVKKEVFTDMYKAGIIDPLKVTKNALKNALSVATTILNTNAIVTIHRYDSNR